MEYEVYRHKDASDEEFDKMDQAFKRVLGEDKWLCNMTQKNLEAGVYVNGQMHPQYEEGPLYLQSLVKKMVLEHHKEEEKLGRKIWPAAQSTTGLSKTNQEIDFCSGLSCGTSEKSAIAW